LKPSIIVCIARPRRHNDKIYHGGSFSSIPPTLPSPSRGEGEGGGDVNSIIAFVLAILIEIERGDKMKKMGQSNLLQELKRKRKEIDRIDQKLLILLNQRLRIVQEIGKIKKETGKKIYDPKREKEILEKLKIKNKGPMKEEDLKKVFNIIIKVCRKFQI